MTSLMHAFPLIDEGLPSGIQEDLFSYLLNDPTINNDFDNIDLDDVCSSPASPPVSSISSPTVSVISSPVSSTSSPSPPPLSLAMLEKPKSSMGLDRKIKLERSSSTGSSDEERQVKRQRRLLKNRESAQLSRLRKKVYIDDLEKKVTALSQDNEALTKRMVAIVENNKQLSEQVVQLQNMLKRSSKKQAIVTANNQSKKMQAAGVCMLMILFSFGLFFNMRTENNEMLREPIRIGRMLNSIEEENHDVAVVHMDAKKEIVVEEQQFQPVVAQPVSHKRAAPESSQPNKKKKGVKVEIKEEPDETGLVVSSVKSGPEQQQIDDIIRESSDSNFVYCSQPQVLWTPESSSVEMPNITFLVPSSNLGSTFHSNGSESETIMEINCQIIGVKFYPIRHSIN